MAKTQSKYIGLNIGSYILDDLLFSSDPAEEQSYTLGRKCSIFKAHRDRNEKIVKAVKIYLKEISGSPTFAREIKEFRIWEVFNNKKLDKSHILDIDDAGFVEDVHPDLNGSAYIIMGYMNNKSLWDHMDMDLEQKLEVCLDAARGLEAAHNTNPPIIHGDIHPGQFLLDTEKGNKLADFGVSAIIERSNEFALSGSGKRAVKYRDPLMEKEKRITLPNDIYQFGRTLLLITTSIDSLDIDTERTLLSGYQDVPRELKDLMIDCMRADPAKRPNSTKLRETLEGIILPSMSPEYKQAVEQMITELGKISKQYRQKEFGALSANGIDYLFSSVGRSYTKMTSKGYKAPISGIEIFVKNTMEGDLQTMAEFLVEHHPSYRGIKIPKKQEGASKFYLDAIDRWEKGTKKQIYFENGIYIID